MIRRGLGWFLRETASGHRFATWCRKTVCAGVTPKPGCYEIGMKHDTDIASGPIGAAPRLDDAEARPLGRSLLRGWHRRCPQCGGGPMMNGYLTVRASCASCGETLHHHRADDMPAWATILIVGHILIFALVTIEAQFSPPVWVHWALWPALTLLLTLWLLPRVKGMIVAMQWSFGMHGFGDDD